MQKTRLLHNLSGRVPLWLPLTIGLLVFFAVIHSRSGVKIEFDPDRRLQGKVLFNTPPLAGTQAEVVLFASLGPKALGTDPSGQESTEQTFHQIKRTKVQPDGSFEFPLPVARDSDRRIIQLAVLGDYLKASPFEYRLGGDRDPGERPVHLRCTVGASVTFELLFPSDASNADIFKVVSREIALDQYLPGDCAPTLRQIAFVDENLRASLRHIPASYCQTALSEDLTTPTANLHPFAIPQPVGIPSRPGEHFRIPLPLEWAPPLKGRVSRVEGNPIAGLEIMAQYKYATSQGGLGTKNFRVDTDEDGRFALYGLPMNQVTLRIEGPGYKPTLVESKRVNEARSQGHDLDLTIDEGHHIFGKVVFPPGRGVARIPIEFRAILTKGRRNTELGETQTMWMVLDAEGRFQIPCTYGAEYELSIELGGGSGPAERLMGKTRCVVSKLTRRKPVVLELFENPSIQGRVTLRHGKDYADCIVFYGRADAGAILQMQDARSAALHGKIQSVAVDPKDGSFSLENLEPGKILIGVQYGERLVPADEIHELEIRGAIRDLVLPVPQER